MAGILGGLLCLTLFLAAQTAPAPDTSSEECEDHNLNVAGEVVDCNYLLIPNRPRDNILGVYKNRALWCDKNHHKMCCQTCIKVREEIEAESNNENKSNGSNSDTGSSKTGDDQPVVGDQPDDVETKETLKVQPKTRFDENPNRQVQHYVGKTSQDGPGFEVFMNLLRNGETNLQAIESIDIKIFPGGR